MKHAISILGLSIQLFVATLAMADNPGFPGRAKFPDVPVIEMKDLKAQFSDVVIVDTRSSYEYGTLRIKGALHISVAAPNFSSKVAKIRQKTSAPIVFYCNGRTCYKSYLAVERAQKEKIENIFSYDAGMLEWARSYPDKSVLGNNNPVDPKKIISKDVYNKRLLSATKFVNKIYHSGKSTQVLDIRDMDQRGGLSFFPGKERWVNLDQVKRVQRVLSRMKKKNKTVLIYDEVGKQSYWFQYALEEAGIKDYYFMKGGARSYYKMIEKNL